MKLAHKMFRYFFFAFFVIFKCVHLTCRYEEMSRARKLLNNMSKKPCILKHAQHGVGEARNVKAECRQSPESENSFYYNITWKPPINTGTNVTGYRVMVLYRRDLYAGVKGCFQLPPSATYFLFNTSVGLAYGCMFRLSVTAQPISNDLDEPRFISTLRESGCPRGPILVPLPNIYVARRSTYFFRVAYMNEPVPAPNISWFFTTDTKNCRNLQPLTTDGGNNIELYSKGMMVKISNVEEDHLGCYVVHVDNGIGRVKVQRGYLNFNNTPFPYQIGNREILTEIQTSIFGAIAGTIVVFVVVGFCIMSRHKSKEHKGSTEGEKFVRPKVYISHCMDSTRDVCLLLEFAASLESCGVDVVADVCSTVEVNTLGGLDRWMEYNMQTAHRVVLVVTPQYLCHIEGANTDCCNQKVLAELQLVERMRSNGLLGKEDVLVLRRDVLDGDVRAPINKFNAFSFPDSFSLENDVNYKKIIRWISQRLN